MSLKDILIRQIETTGPLTIAEYMTQCLLHPKHGYYATRDPLGRKGDFTTAPEISQMFGEMLGLCLAQTWLDQGSPAEFILAELGPGRGTLMRDMLRATARIPGFAPQVHLIEASPTLRDIQAETVGRATWHNDTSTLPDLPLFLIANEFLDALPIRQFQRKGDGWLERKIGVEDGALVFGLSPTSVNLDHRLHDTKEGQLVELCPALPAIIETVSQYIDTQGGAAIFVDYGDWHARGDTFQAVQNHSFSDPLADPGNADLTAHIDFEAITKAATGAVTKMTSQGVLLERLGITARAQALANGLTGAALDQHIAAHRRLTHPDEMGTLFKAIALYPAHASPPPGFDI